MCKQIKGLQRPAGLLLATVLLLAGGQYSLAADQVVSINDSVITALEYNPRLKMLRSNHEAIGFELDRAKGGYFPRLDAAFGYGAESHSDVFTRARDKEHNFYDRLEASLQLTQLLYDGRETASRVGVEDAKLDSARLRVLDNAESIALDAIIAHMEVFRQRELVALAEKNVRDHEEILNMLSERQRAGAGSIADVSQTEGRLARARGSLAETRSMLKSAEANYQRVVGKLAGDVTFFTPPGNLVPKGQDEALQAVQTGNPKVRALDYNVAEAQSRVDLSGSSFLPKVNLEVSTSYEDQVESSETYEHNNQAMVRMRWNLFNGGSDIADHKAAVSRKFQAVNTKDDQLVQVMEETSATWGKLQASKEQVVDYGDATTQSQKTLDAYMKQFAVGQRTLLDVLDARNELFQASGLLVTAKVNEVIAAERLIALSGKLNESLQIDTALYTAPDKAE